MKAQIEKLNCLRYINDPVFVWTNGEDDLYTLLECKCFSHISCHVQISEQPHTL